MKILTFLLPFFSWHSSRDLPLTQKFHDLNFVDVHGVSHSMSEFQGKKILVVNVASHCGFTPQYKALTELQSRYGDKLVVLGFPCNQFMFQEPAGNASIASFCEKNYGVNFLIAQKTKVRGRAQHPVYFWLTHAACNGWNNKKPGWNFFKYLIDEKGQLLTWFSSETDPLSTEITSRL